jgi:hypothetical protein
MAKSIVAAQVSPQQFNINHEAGKMKLTCLATGRNINFMSSQANAWADEELVKQGPAIGDTRKSLSLDNSKNIIEEKAIRAGKERGTKTCRVFDNAWANARDKS